MIQRGNGSRLALKTLLHIRARTEMGGQNLDRNDAIKPRVPRAIDLAHAAGTKRRLNLVSTKFSAKSEPHRARHYSPHRKPLDDAPRLANCRQTGNRGQSAGTIGPDTDCLGEERELVLKRASEPRRSGVLILDPSCLAHNHAICIILHPTVQPG